MSFLDEFNAQNNPSTQSNEPAQRKLTLSEHKAKGKKRLQALAVTFIVGSLLVLLLLQWLGGADDKNKPEAFASVTSEPTATVVVPTPTSSDPTSSAPVTTPAAVPADTFSAGIEVRVYDKMLQDVPYHATITNQASGKVLLDKDFATGEDLSFDDEVLIPTADIATAVRPSYLVTITSTAPGVSGKYLVTADRFVKASGAWRFDVELIVQGDTVEDIFFKYE
jgi:hypothetical protein